MMVYSCFTFIWMTAHIDSRLKPWMLHLWPSNMLPLSAISSLVVWNSRVFPEILGMILPTNINYITNMVHRGSNHKADPIGVVTLLIGLKNSSKIASLICFPLFFTYRLSMYHDTPRNGRSAGALSFEALSWMETASRVQALWRPCPATGSGLGWFGAGCFSWFQNMLSCPKKICQYECEIVWMGR